MSQQTTTDGRSPEGSGNPLKVCAWCYEANPEAYPPEVRQAMEDPGDQCLVSHGMCAAHAAAMLRQAGLEVKEQDGFKVVVAGGEADHAFAVVPEQRVEAVC